jgi:hypothetical protein
LQVAYEKLKRVSGLSDEAAGAVLWPRSHGTLAKRKYLPRYSTRAVTIERARTLDAFHGICDAVAKSWLEMEIFGLTDHSDLIGGWRPADYNCTDEVKKALEDFEPDTALYVWPEGFRLEHMIDAVPAIDLQMIVTNPKGGVISGFLLSDVCDDSDSVTYFRGAVIAIHLSLNDEIRWKSFLMDYQPQSRKAKRVRIVHLKGTSAQLGFESSKL